MDACTDGLIYISPFVVAFVGWAALSWLIVGAPIQQLQGQYGTASMQKAVAGSAASQGQVTSDHTRQMPGHILHCVLSLFPLLPLLAILALVTIVVLRDLRLLAPLSILGGTLLFAILAAGDHKTGGFLRYYISAVPLGVILAGLLASRVIPGRGVGLSGSPSSSGSRLARTFMGTVAALAVSLPSLPTTLAAMKNSLYGAEESMFDPIFHPGSVDTGRVIFRSEQSIATYIDKMGLPHHSILVDNYDACVPPILLDSTHVKQYVIPNDRDFQRRLADPATFGTPYLLAVPNVGLGSIDALNTEYPTLYATGAGIARLVHQFNAPGCPAFRLYKLKASDEGTGAQISSH